MNLKVSKELNWALTVLVGNKGYCSEAEIPHKKLKFKSESDGIYLNGRLFLNWHDAGLIYDALKKKPQRS